MFCYQIQALHLESHNLIVDTSKSLVWCLHEGGVTPTKLSGLLPAYYVSFCLIGGLFWGSNFGILAI